MIKLLHKKTKLLMLIFAALFLSAFSGYGAPPRKMVNGSDREFRSLKGVCNCYKEGHKKYKPSAKYVKFQKRNHNPKK